MEDESVVRFVSSWLRGTERVNGDRQKGLVISNERQVSLPKSRQFFISGLRLSHFKALGTPKNTLNYQEIYNTSASQLANPRCSQFLSFIIHQKLIRKREKKRFFFCVVCSVYLQLMPQLCYAFNIYLKSKKNKYN